MSNSAVFFVPVVHFAPGFSFVPIPKEGWAERMATFAKSWRREVP
jgi:hypothetical protein